MSEPIENSTRKSKTLTSFHKKLDQLANRISGNRTEALQQAIAIGLGIVEANNREQRKSAAINDFLPQNQEITELLDVVLADNGVSGSKSSPSEST